MNYELSKSRVASLASRRRKLIEIEQAIFKSRTHTSVEILVLLIENDFRCKLSFIYRQTRATDASVRQHLRVLGEAGIVEEREDDTDGRAKAIIVTAAGREILVDYIRALSGLMANSDE